LNAKCFSDWFNRLGYICVLQPTFAME